MGLKDKYEQLPQASFPRKQFIKAVAKDCGVAETTVYRWLSGESNPKDAHLKICAEHLNCSLDELR